MAMSSGNIPGDDDEIVAEINMTPLIDIMLVLLIIFMVTSTVTLESGLDINIPKTNSKTESKDGNSVMVSMDIKGVLSVQGVEVTMENLKEAISAALKSEQTQMVIFEGDKLSTLEKTLEVMDIAKEAGADKFAIAAESAE
jgi:biopolymer transport protein ExbD